MDKNYKLVYNPKYLEVKGNKTINVAKITDMYGAREGGVESGKLIEKPAVYSVAPSEIKKFRSDIADYLLGKYGFLEEVDPKNLDEKLKEIKDKRFKCKYCDFETDTKVALAGHSRSHSLSDEAKSLLEEIPEAQPDAYVIGAGKSQSGRTELISAEQAEGIPETSGNKTAKDGDNVEWYGDGLQQNRRRGGMRPVRRRNTPGMQPVAI